MGRTTVRVIATRPLKACRRWLLDLYRPVDVGGRGDLDDPADETSLRARLERDGVTVQQCDDPLGVAGLRPSLLFPQRFLHRRDDGRSVLLSTEEAAQLVIARLRETPGTATTGRR